MKVLVFGGTGMLGSMVVRVLVQQGHDVTFTTRERLPSWFPLKQKLAVQKFDVSNNIPDLTEFEWVINCIGTIKQKNASAFEYYSTNSVFPWKLATACEKAKTRLIHMSSDCVFSGVSEGPYRPDDLMDAVDDYGRSKALGEPVGAVVLRTSIVGPSDDNHGLFAWFFDGKHKADGYTNHHWSGVTTYHLANYMHQIITGKIFVPKEGGLIQLASPAVTKCELLELFDKVFEHDVLVTPTEAPERVNRVLVPSVGYEKHISLQLAEMRDWMAQQ